MYDTKIIMYILDKLGIISHDFVHQVSTYRHQLGTLMMNLGNKVEGF